MIRRIKESFTVENMKTLILITLLANLMFLVFVDGDIGVEVVSITTDLVLTLYVLSLMAFECELDLKVLTSCKWKSFIGWTLGGFLIVEVATAIGSLFNFVILHKLFGMVEPAVIGKATEALVNSEVGSAPWRLMIFSAIVTAPLFEEVLFRGYFYKVLNTKLNMFISMIIPSVIFAALHADLWALFPMFFFAMAINIIYEITENLTIIIVIHSLANIVVLMQLFG